MHSSKGIRPIKSSQRDGSFKLSFTHVFIMIVVVSFTVPVIFVLVLTKFGNIKTLQTTTWKDSTLSPLAMTHNMINSKNTQQISHDKTKFKRYAFAITITKDGFFQDGAAVLAYSIVRMFNQSTDSKFSLIAFVHPSVVEARIVLQRLGYHVIEAPTPVNVSAISGPILRDKIDKNGCCGASELIKLNSYRLLQYDKVIHMDADTFFLNSIVELFNEKRSLIFTTDPNMASHKGDRYMPVQGGFIVLEPSAQDFENLINIIMTTEFYMGSAWNGTKIGWFWGGMTVQGVLPYYYNAATTPGRSLMLDRCIYNTMADTPECLKRGIDEIKSAHFTICQKPWPGNPGGQCQHSYANDLCRALHESWFQMRKEAEAFYGVTVNQNSCKPRYTPIDFTSAKFPTLPQYIYDESPDFMRPITSARFISDNYEQAVGGHKNKK